MARAAEAPRWLMPAVAAAHGAALLAALQPAAAPITPPRPLAVALLAPAAPQPAPAARPEPRRPQPTSPPRSSPLPLRGAGGVSESMLSADYAGRPCRACPGARSEGPGERAATAPTPFVAPEPAPTAASAPAAPATLAAASPAAHPAPVAQPARFDAAYLRNPKPPYPGLARRLGEQGRVLLRVFVSAHGLPEKVEIEASSGSPRLDQSALETVRAHWRFEPARLGDKPVPDWVRVPIGFILEG